MLSDLRRGLQMERTVSDMNTWRICEHCEHCVYDIGSGLQCDFDSPDLKSVTAEESCRYFSLNEDYVDELSEDNADLRTKLAAAEKERDEERAHNAVLRDTLEFIAARIGNNVLYWDDEPVSVDDYVEMALATTPSDSAERVQGLVDALEYYAKGEHIFAFTGSDRDRAGERARQALAEWRGEK